MGWLAQHANRLPDQRWLYALDRLCDRGFIFRWAVGLSDQQRSLVEEIRLGRAEAYDTWASICGDKIVSVRRATLLTARLGGRRTRADGEGNRDGV